MQASCPQVFMVPLQVGLGGQLQHHLASSQTPSTNMHSAALKEMKNFQHTVWTTISEPGMRRAHSTGWERVSRIQIKFHKA